MTPSACPAKQATPKLATLIQHIGQLLKDGFRPVVFCRYVATAHYVAEHLKKAFPKVGIEAVTGELTPEERRERVESLEEAESHILVATDCLSEGINLQHLFTAVVHYDLTWNPTRHEQREGRVDRFGQQAEEVRCTMLYGEDNPVDGFVLNVILRKAEAIRRELGVLVPMPEDDTSIKQAMIRAALMKRQDHMHSIQASLDFGDAEEELAPLRVKWQDALDRPRPTVPSLPSAPSAPRRCYPNGKSSSRHWAPSKMCSAFWKVPVCDWVPRWKRDATVDPLFSSPATCRKH